MAGGSRSQAETARTASHWKCSSKTWASALSMPSVAATAAATLSMAALKDSAGRPCHTTSSSGAPASALEACFSSGDAGGGGGGSTGGERKIPILRPVFGSGPPSRLSVSRRRRQRPLAALSPVAAPRASPAPHPSRCACPCPCPCPCPCRGHWRARQEEAPPWPCSPRPRRIQGGTKAHCLGGDSSLKPTRTSGMVTKSVIAMMRADSAFETAANP